MEAARGPAFVTRHKPGRRHRRRRCRSPAATGDGADPSTGVDNPVDNGGMTAKVTSCKRCERDVAEVGPLSARKLCHGCGVAAVIGSIYQLQARSGPMYERWRRRLLLVLFDLDTPVGTSLDLISDEALTELLSTGTADALR